MIKPRLLQKLAEEHGTPLFVVDHQALRDNYAMFKKYLPRVQAYYAVKANSDPAIVQTLYDVGASFDVASIAEFRLVYKNIKSLPARERQDYIWDKIIYAHPIKDNATLTELDKYKPLVTYDNFEEIKKVARFAPHAGLMLPYQGAQHRRRGGTVVKVRRRIGRRRRSYRSRFQRGPRRRRAQLPRRQPVHQLRQLRPGPQPRGRDLQGSPGSRPSRGENPRHWRRLPRPLRSTREALARSGQNPQR